MTKRSILDVAAALDPPLHHALIRSQSHRKYIETTYIKVPLMSFVLALNN